MNKILSIIEFKLEKLFFIHVVGDFILMSFLSASLKNKEKNHPHILNMTKELTRLE